MIDLKKIEAATEGLLSKGMAVMNSFMLGDTESEHIIELMELMDPDDGSHILDAGCGIGAVAKGMKALNPSLSFTLLNVSQHQLDLCPPGMTRVLGSFDAMPFEDRSFDVVMFNYSICHADNWLTTLSEAHRVLRPGGSLFIFDMARNSGGNDLMRQHLSAAVYKFEDIADVLRRAGFLYGKSFSVRPKENRLKEMMGASYDQVVGDVYPIALSMIPATFHDEVEAAFERHGYKNIGFQFSGGRDSTAALYQLRKYWPVMKVYHLDTGDQFPETIEVVRQVESDLGKPLIRIHSDVAEVRREYGLASDLVPVDNTEFGRRVSGRVIKIISRYDCCVRSLMKPMHQRIEQDGITLLIRGQRDDEYKTPPMRSGDVQGALEVLYPIQSWTGEQVSKYLKDNNLPIAPFYERGARRAPECMGCTAWWDEGRAKYLRQYHPEKYAEYKLSMAFIRHEIDNQLAMLEE